MEASPARTRRYVLLIRQQPESARCCGFGGDDVNPRPIDPIVIVQLGILRSDGTVNTSISLLADASSLVAHCALLSPDYEDRSVVVVPTPSISTMPMSSVGLPSYETPRQSFSLQAGAPMLSSTVKVSDGSKQTSSQASNSRAPIEVDPWVSELARSAETSTGASPSVASASPTGALHERSGDKSQELSAPGPPAMSTHHQHTLTGLVISPSYYLTDLQGSKGVFFIFSEMGVRVAGRFRLRISLVDLRSTIAASGPSHNSGEPSRDSATELTSVVTDVFEVYGVRDFPGQKESPELVRHFAEQGVRVGVRRRGSTK